MAFYFRLPVITDLTIEQQAVLNEPGPIAVSGGPGTGKSVVSLWRHIRNHDTKKRKSLLLTYTKSLEAYLKASAQGENDSAGSHVSRTYSWTYNGGNHNYGEIIIDEAQDVELAKYQLLNQLTEMVSYSADDNQMLYPSKGVTEVELQNLFTSNSSYNLIENFRNTTEIVQFVKSMFPLRLISQGKESGPAPTIICSDGDSNLQNKILLELIENFKSATHNIAILVPLQNQVNSWYNFLNSNNIKCSKFVTNDGDIGVIENIHITTFKSAKGLEFDTVILPDFNLYEDNIQNLNVVEENDYYVVFTRTRRNLFLLDNNETNGGKCQLTFVQNQISRNIIKVDYSYINTTPLSTPSVSDDDDLPF
jgi:superfamily I DNA/RNA helicase